MNESTLQILLQTAGDVWMILAFIVIIGAARATWHDWHSIERACKKRRKDV
jgi:hypothetical protein